MAIFSLPLITHSPSPAKPVRAVLFNLDRSSLTGESVGVSRINAALYKIHLELRKGVGITVQGTNAKDQILGQGSRDGASAALLHVSNIEGVGRTRRLSKANNKSLPTGPKRHILLTKGL